MKPIEVTARFSLQGEITPLAFTIDQKEIPITSVGRRWSDLNGVHILVMAPGKMTYELFFAKAENRWYLGYPGPERKLV